MIEAGSTTSATRKPGRSAYSQQPQSGCRCVRPQVRYQELLRRLRVMRAF